MSVPHPIPYQGSKRNLTHAILKFFPSDAARLIEPFAGSSAVSLAAAYYRTVDRFVLNDINEALMDLWRSIINEPEVLAAQYKKLWEAQEERGREHYDVVRKRFNQLHRPDHFLYLLARCVKASVRYNSYGAFNQSPDNRRKGAHPRTMRSHIAQAAYLLSGKVQISCRDYASVLEDAAVEDIVYMDPPYQGVCGNRDQRYIGKVAFEDFIRALGALNGRAISYILSYDGRTGSKTYGQPMPDHLELTHVEIDAGRSSQDTLLGRNSRTFESLYLSPALVDRLGRFPKATLFYPCKQLLLSEIL